MEQTGCRNVDGQGAGGRTKRYALQSAFYRLLAVPIRLLLGSRPAPLLPVLIFGLLLCLLSVNAPGKLDHVLLLCTGLAAGLALAAYTFAFYTRRTQALISFADDDGEGLSLIDKSIPIPALAKLLAVSTQKSGELSDALKTLGQEADMLVERYRTLTENLAAAIVIRDGEGKIAYCSPYTEVLTGYSLAEIYASAQDFFLSIIHEEDRDKYSRALKVTSFGEAFQFRYRFLHKTGIEMWAETRTVPIVEESGSVSSSLSITLDVTGIIRHQKQIEEKNRDLEDFSYMISHDLKAPIFTIKGMLGIIEEDFRGKLDGDLNDALSHIANAAKRLEALVGSVLEYSRIGTPENSEEPVELSAVLREIGHDFKPQIEEAGAVLKFPEEFPVLVGDRLKLYQIFSNLIGNAIKYRAKERTLMIEITAKPGRSDRYVRISVKDNGMGIPQDKQALIFRPFQRAHGKEIEGSGIGLACVKRLLEKLGGEIEFESVENAGSEFVVTLKTARDGAAAAQNLSE